MRNRRQTAAAGAAVAAVMVMTAACGGSSDQGQDRVAPAGDSSSLAPDSSDFGTDSNAPAAGGDKGGPAKTLTLRQDADLGGVVTDSAGWTLYRFEEDTADPAKSNCDGDCATAWPPVPAEDASAAEGIDAKLLGKVTRTDGKEQLTLGGWPVYRYAKDVAPGDTKGHGVGGTWNALAANGGKAGQASSGGDEAAGSGEDVAGGGSDAELSAVQDPELGTLVADEEGRILYRFDKDTAWPMKSNCEGECLETWKPAKPVDKNKLEGIDPEHIFTVKRSDGTEQLAIDCWPVYWFTGDAGPGDTEGHLKGNVWHAITPDGKKAKSGS
ncbi:SCO0930 family lipoprotein [Streptomyces sp. 549]|uniref:SCO0930 family lipoprotein n=1 Tax=Streptomyces sp. 549 TaxID=3049076 RepID=UPI0024C442F7|nr:SCO0930 family lipoprotein [Streptomyces sp. 549]MDK1473320.1 SCO0930 family lipoprotein [Streptomyces sp. 549]